MSRMQIVQQNKPLTTWEKAKAPLKVAAVVLVQTAAVIASIVTGTGIFAIAAAIALSLGMAITLKEKIVIYAAATAFTAVIVGVSLAALFPVTAPFMLSLVCFTATFAFGWGLKQEIAQIGFFNRKAAKISEIAQR